MKLRDVQPLAKYCVAIILFALSTAAAQAQFTFATNGDNTVTLTGCNGYLSGSVEIPDTYFTNGINMPVTAIGYFAFNDQTMTDITTGTNMISIGIEAFWDCYSLQNVILNTNVSGIGNSAFGYCTGLRNITIPNRVVSMGVDVFDGCTSLSSVTIVPGLTNIPNDTFYGCSSLGTLTIPDSVVSIGSGAFGGQCGLGSIIIPSTVTSFADASPFSSCSGMTSITVDPNNPAYSSLDGVMFDKNQRTLIEYPKGRGGSSYNIPDTVTNIGTEAFYGCSLTSVTVPHGVTSIGSDAFFSSPNLAGIYFAGNAPGLGSFVFYSDNAIAYYLPGTTGWGATLGNLTAALWTLPYPVILNFEPGFGVHAKTFEFPISWATNISVVVEVSTNLANSAWIPVSTNSLSGGTFDFSDSGWTNDPVRFYRVCSP
jgi:BspA type Leucine rich repeat region (6 copies)